MIDTNHDADEMLLKALVHSIAHLQSVPPISMVPDCHAMISKVTALSTPDYLALLAFEYHAKLGLDLDIGYCPQHVSGGVEYIKRYEECFEKLKAGYRHETEQAYINTHNALIFDELPFE